MNLADTDVKEVKCGLTQKDLMNIANLAEASKPQIIHNSSQRSTSASDEYFSDYASDASSSESRLDRAQYETPPSRISTPAIQHPIIDSEMTLPVRPAASRPPPLNVRLNQTATYGDMPQPLANNPGDMSPPTPGMDDTPYIRFAIEQLTRDEELLGRGRQGSVTSADYPTNRFIQHEGLGYYDPPVDTSQPPGQSEQPPSGTFEKIQATDDILLPVAPPRGTQWSNLQFVPTILRLPLLLLLVLICLLMITGLIFSNIHATRSKGLYDYDGTGTARYFVFQFLPQLLGICIILWLFVVQAAIYRALPYFVLAAEPPRDCVLQGLRILPANFLFPDVSFFNHGDPGIGLVLLVFWLANFTVPLLSCLYQTEWFLDEEPARWRWTSVQAVGWVLVALYSLLTLALLYCISRFRAQKSALMWDPVSLADLIPLFQRSNVLTDFERSEVSRSIREHIPPRFLRLGYWTTSRGSDIFHTVGEEGAPYNRPSTTRFGMEENLNEQDDSDSFDVERQRYSYASSFTRNIHSPFVRYRWAPWFVHDSAILAWQIIAIILLIAFLVVSFVNSAVHKGFLPLLPSGTNSGGFSPSDFLYSFLPSLLGMILFLAWQSIDTYFRAVQPFVNLSHPSGATAEHSLLLAYPSCFPIEATVLAVINRDLKVAFTSSISLLSLTIPVLAGGIFTAQFFKASNSVRMATTMPAYYALCVFLAIYAFSFLAVWPTRKRYLPHKINTVGDLLSFLYQSPLLTDAAFQAPATKADLVGRLVVGFTGTGSRVPKYAFGIYTGRDGKEHLGVDRLQRTGSGEMLVTTASIRQR